jgi:hypothetical protein
MSKLLAVALVLFASCVSAEAQWRHRGGGGGGGFAGGLLGGVIGGVIGGAFAPRPYYQPPVYQQPPVYYQQPGYYVSQEQIAWCIQRYRSYNPQTLSYMGYDGYAHRCPR